MLKVKHHIDDNDVVVFLLLTMSLFFTVFKVSIVEFEQVNVSRGVNYNNRLTFDDCDTHRLYYLILTILKKRN